jgi:hypothetical protein
MYPGDLLSDVLPIYTIHSARAPPVIYVSWVNQHTRVGRRALGIPLSNPDQRDPEPIR